MTDLQRELTAKIEALGVERDEASAAIAQGIQLETKVQYFHFFPFLSTSVHFFLFLFAPTNPYSTIRLNLSKYFTFFRLILTHEPYSSTTCNYV